MIDTRDEYIVEYEEKLKKKSKKFTNKIEAVNFAIEKSGRVFHYTIKTIYNSEILIENSKQLKFKNQDL